MAKDIVADFLRRVREQHPEVPEMRWRKLEVDLRRDWGGERVYVVKAKPQGKAYSLAESLAAGRSLDEARAELHVHRSTCWRWLRRGWVKGFIPS
jgi:hypothetical protein